jgi:proteic killer suppression protein
LNIAFRSQKLRKDCNDYKRMVRRFGAVGAKKLSTRLDDLRAARVLEDMRHVSGRCHELRGNRAGQFALDLHHPYRLIFVPANDPVPRKSDGTLDWTRVDAVVIQGVEDYHG